MASTYDNARGRKKAPARPSSMNTGRKTTTTMALP